MNTPCTVQWRESNRDLHIRLDGSFHPVTASELENLLQQRYTGAGRVFVDVRALRVEDEVARDLFRQCLGPVPAEKTFFKGEQGVALGRNGSRVLLVKAKGCGCTGGCQRCACSLRAAGRVAGRQGLSRA